MAVALSARWICRRLAPLIPEAHCPLSVLDGVRNRLCFKRPDCQIPNFKARLRSYVRQFMRRSFKTVDNARVIAIGNLQEWWLQQSTTYPEKKKQQMWLLWVMREGLLKAKDYFCSIFVKTESYEEPKHPRIISARSDMYKMFSGPWVKLMEEVVYQSPFFIKHVPQEERGTFVGRLQQAGHTYLSSDFSSFELHMDKHIQSVVEHQIYAYLLREVPSAAEFLRVHRRTLTKEQKLVNKWWSFLIPACRMSGETCTSLGNGLTNLCLVGFVAEVFGGRIQDAVVEGDDGIYVIKGHVPTEEDFAKAGMVVKLVACDDLSRAGFCSMYYVDVGGQRVAMRDAREKLPAFGWSMSNLRFGNDDTLKGLLLAKALSLACELGSCPIFWVIPGLIIRETSGTQPIFEVDGYHKEPKVWSTAEPSSAVRAAYAQLFDISVDQQLEVEQEIRLFGLRGPAVERLCWTDQRFRMSESVFNWPVGMPINYRNQAPILTDPTGA